MLTIEQIIRMVRIALEKFPEPTEQNVDDEINLISQMYPDINYEEVKSQILANMNIYIPQYSIIEDAARRRPWLHERKANIDWKFWQRYRTYLKDKKMFPVSVLNQLDSLTDRILDGLFFPEEGNELRKYGMVVGQVQSGKTANYTGLCCKAADAGFRFIIILAGIHNSLRSQTQLRIDEGFLGFDTQFNNAFNWNGHYIGVGNINPRLIAHSLTSSANNGDFSQRYANNLGINFHTDDPIILVVKKNISVLRTLFNWLRHKGSFIDNQIIINGKSLLMIDDEADFASINTNPAGFDPTPINASITGIMKLFSKAAYIGYTATPFANIFIPDEKDSLFPRDFIINIPPPSNYIGPDKVFGFGKNGNNHYEAEPLPLVFHINDHDAFFPDGHRMNDDLPKDLPESLKNAIKTFILVCAVRRIRGDINAHNSMLIHVSRFKRWQNGVARLVDAILKEYQNAIAYNQPWIFTELQQLFENGIVSFKSVTEKILNSRYAEIDPKIEEHQWEKVECELHNAASRIQIKKLNGGSKDVLDYVEHQESGLSVIAIGGNKLSRGLTLEGLSVSYFLRSSLMYDTLMQMGRWFGYKPGFLDLCRLYTTASICQWFSHITLAVEELRDEFDYMSNIANSTPDSYSLKVRTHPGGLKITAANRMRTARSIQVSWGARLVETYQLLKSENVRGNNLSALEILIHDLDKNETSDNGDLIYFDVKPEQIKSFLQSLTYPNALKKADSAIISDFIDNQIKNNELISWRVALRSKSNPENHYSLQIHGQHIQIGLFKREFDDKNSTNEIYHLKKSRLLSPWDECIDFTETEKAKAMERTREEWSKANRPGVPQYPSGQIVRSEIRNPQNPLLIIYLLDPIYAGVPTCEFPFLAYAISFPRSDYLTQSLEYAMNQIEESGVVDIYTNEELEEIYGKS